MKYTTNLIKSEKLTKLLKKSEKIIEEIRRKSYSKALVPIRNSEIVGYDSI